MDEPIPQIRIALALIVGLATFSYGVYQYLNQAPTPDTGDPLVVMGGGVVIFLLGVIRWGRRRKKL